MDDAVIVAACRTAVGRAPKGTLRNTRPEQLGVTVIKNLLERAGGVSPEQVDDVVIGCSFPESEQGVNLARCLVLGAGWPDRVPGVTVNRFCASGLEAIAVGAQRIMSGAADVIVAGGVESMSRIPLGGNLMYPYPDLVDRRPGSYAAMGLTAEKVAERYKVDRKRQDEIAVRSHARAAKAIAEGRFESQIVPVEVREQFKNAKGRFEFKTTIFKQDEGVRADTTMESLTGLKPAFMPDGVVTAGNSSQMSDGAAAVLLMSRSRASKLGLEPLATFRGYAAEGCEPEYMGLGPIGAIPKLMQRTGMSIADIDLFELNEAFAAQAIAVMDTLSLDPEKTNVNGGAIALGHPLGCTGAKLTTQIVHELRASKKRFGVVSMCIGFGMGAAGLFEV
ncbi:MAG: thiolase family protein [Myxococcota bacterium]|nr:thiolase family protein [Myxococcota bacterium]